MERLQVVDLVVAVVLAMWLQYRELLVLAVKEIMVAMDLKVTQRMLPVEVVENLPLAAMAAISSPATEVMERAAVLLALALFMLAEVVEVLELVGPLPVTEDLEAQEVAEMEPFTKPTTMIMMVLQTQAVAAVGA